MFARAVNEFAFRASNVADGVKPANAQGTAVTPAQNAYGAYVTLIAAAALTVDCLELCLCVNNVGISTVARDCVVSIAVDTAGGSNFAGNSIVDLVCGPAAIYSGGTYFQFSIWIPAGASIGAAAAVNSANLTAINVLARVRGAPSHPELLYVGTYIDQFGVNLAASCGTALTPGIAAEGAYVQLGTLARPCYQWEFGYGDSSGAMANNLLEADIALGTAGNKRPAILNAPLTTTAGEAITKSPIGGPMWCAGVSGDNVYARSQGLSAPATHTVAAYGVGG